MGTITEEIPANEEVEETEAPVEEQEPAEEDDTETDSEANGETESEEDEDIVTIGDENEPLEPDEKHMALWMRETRSINKTQKKRIRELENKIEQLKGVQPQTPVTPGPKPTLEACDYDSDQFEQKLSDWYDAKAKHADAKAALDREQQRQQEAYQENIRRYQEKKKTLRVRDYEDAESLVEETLSIAQQNIIVEGADNAALIVYALGKNPKRLQELEKIKNLPRFAFEVAKLEKELKVSKRKPKTAPEKSIKSTGTLSGTTDRTLERLRDEAAKTGDMSKVMAYKRKKRAAG